MQVRLRRTSTHTKAQSWRSRLHRLDTTWRPAASVRRLEEQLRWLGAWHAGAFFFPLSCSRSPPPPRAFEHEHPPMCCACTKHVSGRAPRALGSAPAPPDCAADRQVYGAYKYPRAQMHQLRPGPAVAAAGPLTPQVLTSPADGATRRVGPFEMKPQVALRCGPPSVPSLIKPSIW